jgi:hypothetical protein
MFKELTVDSMGRAKFSVKFLQFQRNRKKKIKAK